MKRFFDAFKAWNKNRLTQKSQKLFAALYKDPATGMQKIIHDAGCKVGAKIAMGMLDRLNVLHCHFCPEVAPLRNHPMGKLCEPHFQLVQRPPTIKQEVVPNGN